MIIKQLVDIVYDYYYEGRAKATAQTLNKANVGQMVMLSYGQILRDKFKQSKKEDKFNEADYTYAAPILDIKEIQLSEPNVIGMRRADMSQYDLYRLPKDGHIVNMYPIGGTCGSEKIGKITLVKAGEENFYLSAKFSFFQFGVIKGKGINFYHLPICVTKVAVETTYNSNDIEVTFDLGYEVALSVLGIMFKEKQFPIKIIDNPYDANVVDLKHRLQEQQNVAV